MSDAPSDPSRPTLANAATRVRTDTVRIDPAALRALMGSPPEESETPTRLPRSAPSPSLLSALEGPTVAEEDGAELQPDPEALRFREREEIGLGGMARVIRVEDEDLKRDLAKKVLLSPEHYQRFIEEAQVTSQLEHPGVLPVYDFGIDDQGDLFFTMQLIRTGVTVREVIDRLRANDPEQHAYYTFERRVQLIQQVCHALQYAHDRGVIHRDIKPSNIMVGEHGEVYLVDWGIAKVLDAPQAPRVDLPPGDPTRDEGLLVGTPAYMAPEQAMGNDARVDRRTDTYAVCTVLYELLTLRHPLGDPNVQLAELVSRTVLARPVDAETFRDPFNGRVPRFLSRLCRKGLAKKPADRFQSARQLEEALQRWLEGNAPIVCPGTAIQRFLAWYSDLIDDHPTLVPWSSILLLAASLLIVAGLALHALAQWL